MPSSPEYSDLSPSQIVPLLADKGMYYCFESTTYRLLRKMEMNTHRQPSWPQRHKKSEECLATEPNQVWSWDITYLPLQARGRFLYLYMMMDICSRKVVAWQVHDCESDELAADLITEACFLERIEKKQIVLHSDNGAPMKWATMHAKLQDLSVTPSFSRPSVSDDNPYSNPCYAPSNIDLHTLSSPLWILPMQGLGPRNSWIGTTPGTCTGRLLHNAYRPA